MRAAVLVLACGAAAMAQEANPAPTGPQAPGLFVDGIVASVNDSTILQSKLFTTIAGPVRTAEARKGGELTPREIQILMRQDLMRLIQRYQMAQAAKSFGHLKPEQIEQLLNSELDRDKQDLVRDVGGVLAFSDELERQGQTWPMYKAEKRIEKLHDFAKQFAVYERLRKQSTLYLTPRMLRETYEANRAYFVHGAEAKVALVQFKGSDAAANAKAASDFWKTGDWSAQEVAKRFSDATPLPPLLGSKLASPTLKDFALKGPLGNVSAPESRRDGTFLVGKVMDYIEARDGKFTDPDVQAEVRRIAEGKVIREFEVQALQRARDRTEFWIYQGSNRIQPR